jgi:hypothetical protein
MNTNDLADRLEQFYSGTHIQKAAEELRRLYANQEKTLTDDEIKDVWSKTVCSVHMTKSELDFARAILKKAKE